ncbi:MAG: REP-associated tyrosine transposase [Thermodesulfobacteriota bacterium]|nr:REP-associated tyrosine transposase [Thermodesulfobacteriota bacterium]
MPHFLSRWVEECLGDGAKERQDERTASIAVGGRLFIEKGRSLLGFRAKGRDVVEAGEAYQPREGAGSYKVVFVPEKDNIGAENT